MTGLLVPGLYPAIAVVKLPQLAPVTGLLVPGLMYPEMGLPELDIGLTIWEIPPDYPEEVIGLEKLVPGLGALLIALSSIKISATPSSSISRSSIYAFFVKALHFNSHAA